MRRGGLTNVATLSLFEDVRQQRGVDRVRSEETDVRGEPNFTPLHPRVNRSFPFSFN